MDAHKKSGARNLEKLAGPIDLGWNMCLKGDSLNTLDGDNPPGG